MDFPYYPTDIPSYLVDAVMVGTVIGLIFALAFAFLFYIFNAIGLYNIAKKRGYRNAWIAFVPIVNSYVLGAVTDNINACYMKKSNFRIWLVILKITAFVLSIANVGILFNSFYDITKQAVVYGVGPENTVLASIFLCSSILGLLNIIVLILNCLCWYKIYVDYNQNNATLFLILSILFGIAPFFIFAIRNKPSASLYYANQRINQQQYQANAQYQTPQQPVSENENKSNTDLN